MFLDALIRSDLNLRDNNLPIINEESKSQIKQRCADLGISTIMNPETGGTRQDLKPIDITNALEIAVHKKARKISAPFLKPSKKDVRNAIDFLELLGVFASQNEILIVTPEVLSKQKSAAKMLEQLEYLRKNMTVSKSVLKLNAKTTEACIDKFFSKISLTQKLALKEAVFNAEKIIKQYFQ
ncbi:MAG: hypothetical protein H0T62_07445 [Parachlamydiaceae bacterium]|nr:hypothetical protein [Parachlamydiaceae bacterium]